MHDAYIGGRSENNIKCILHDDLGWKNQTTRYILPRHWLYEWFYQFHRCGIYSVLSRSHSINLLNARYTHTQPMLPCGSTVQVDELEQNHFCYNYPPTPTMSSMCGTRTRNRVHLRYNVLRESVSPLRWQGMLRWQGILCCAVWVIACMVKWRSCKFTRHS